MSSLANAPYVDTAEFFFGFQKNTTAHLFNVATKSISAIDAVHHS